MKHWNSRRQLLNLIKLCNIASMLNKHGHGTLYFGVSPDGEVTGQAISHQTLNDVAKKISEAIRPIIYPNIQKVCFDDVDVVQVEFSGVEKPYSAFGRYYKRVHDRTEEMTPAELRSEMFSSDVGLIWENHPTQYGLEAIDHEALQRFYNKAIACDRLEELPVYNEDAILSGLGLLVDGHLTNAGYYLFSNKKPIVLKIERGIGKLFLSLQKRNLDRIASLLQIHAYSNSVS